ncbi:Ribosomal protein L7/L12 C-terminal/adaptor protein ClpS-like [Arabidopsis suecica]|nr:Ribosomal protein L7/L12 C-terminal/adaptor protein ClpS-like [Arabidopsis suecica]
MIKLNELESFTDLGLKEAKALVEKTPAILKARLCKKKAREVDEAGTLEDQEEFIKDVKAFHKENFLEFKSPKFYGQPLNCFK